jgi:LysM repeat protein
MRLNLILLAFCPLIWPFNSSNIFSDITADPAIIYIKKYSMIAKNEMSVSGIPASIKMAQALIESEYGMSELAVNSNNHFGIKCGSKWNGKTYYKKDDDTNENGDLIESCFRAFDNVSEAFKAHSEFLTDPKKEKRYGFLFTLPTQDYKAWAQGLKDAGYATDPNYPNKLIRVIEKYQLYNLDNGVIVKKPNEEKSKEVFVATTNSTAKQKEIENTKETTLKFRSNTLNETKCIVLSDKSTLEKIARHFKHDLGELISHNEFLYSSSKTIPSGHVIFLEKKEKSYKGNEKTHKVKKDEAIESISNKYGFRAKTLYHLNRLKNGEQPIEGQVLNLKSKVEKCNTPKSKKDDSRKYLFE